MANVLMTFRLALSLRSCRAAGTDEAAERLDFITDTPRAECVDGKGRKFDDAGPSSVPRSTFSAYVAGCYFDNAPAEKLQNADVTHAVNENWYDQVNDELYHPDCSGNRPRWPKVCNKARVSKNTTCRDNE